MKTTQRRPSPRALALGAALWLLALGVEVAGLVAGPTAASTLASADLEASTIVLALALVAAGVAVVDLASIRWRPAPEVRRIPPRSLALEAWAEIVLEVRSAGPLGGAAELVDGVPDAAEVRGLPIRLDPKARRPQRGAYRLRPLARGDARFGRVVLRAESPLRLWRYTAELGEPESVRVFPNFAATARFDELVTHARTRDAGVRRRQRRGEGLEFHQLREYRPGDTIRQIDWKATSRKRTLISREYEEERDQRIVFWLDCSRRMRTRDGPVSHFDHALDALILLAHVAAKGGDAVGLLSFGEERRWVPPAKGTANVNRLLHQVYDLEPTTLGVDFRGAAEELGRRQRRRSLVVLATHLRPEDEVDLLPAIRLLRRTHFVVVADLRQRVVDELLARDPRSAPETFAAIGAWREALDRRALHERLRGEGVQPLDVRPDQLGPALVSRYYAVKQGGAL